MYRATVELAATDLDLRIQDREIVRSEIGENLLRVRFSFVSYRGYVAEDDVHRSTGVIWFPVGSDREARPARFGKVVMTEYPPGSSSTEFAFHTEYGERPAIELGLPAVVVDLRGPVVQDLRLFTNPADDRARAFSSEEQFRYYMLHSYQKSSDYTLLYEYRVAEAWLRALRAVDLVVAEEVQVARNRFLLVGQGYGAAGAIQAASVDDAVEGLVLCGTPLDPPDLHFTRWRRWERRARYRPLDAIQPIPYRDSEDLLSFLFSSFGKPDPACPECTGGGDVYRAQFGYLDLHRAGLLRGVRTLVLVGDSDPDAPIDLELRASFPAEIEVAPPGPFAERYRLPFHDLRYLRGSASRLANDESAEAVLAWIQHVNGYRDVPKVRIVESVQDGELVLEVQVKEGNATVTSIEVYLTEIEDRRDTDFKWQTHLEEPEPVTWRRFDAIFGGHDRGFVGTWRAYLPVNLSRNRAYYAVIRDRVGELETGHSLPVRTFWHLGDPAVGPARF